MTIALCPGSFDPPTLGHLDVFERAAAMFEAVVVAAVANPSKGTLFELAERVGLLQQITSHIEGVSVVGFDGLVIEAARRAGATVIIKGVRSSSDAEFELPMAAMNRHLSGVETVLLPADSATSHISSSLVREIARLGGIVDTLVPEPVLKALKEKLP